MCVVVRRGGGYIYMERERDVYVHSCVCVCVCDGDVCVGRVCVRMEMCV